ncbi:protein Mdm4 isoform X6 [Chionomys nivalis]|nr:protein Mdm4 isoform X6 [Chionomys nivalis]
MDIPSQDRLKHSASECSNSRKRTAEDDTHTLPTSQCKSRDSKGDEDLIEHLTQDETSRLDLDFEEWDIAGLPWWFLGNLRNNYVPRSNGSTDLQTNQDIGTAIVSDTTDDLWFLNESVSEQLGVGIKVEAANSEQTSEVGKARDKKVIDVGKDDLEDPKSLSDDTDVELTSEDEWQCTECKKFNSPSKRYCFRCWALRKDWYSDCSKLTHSLSTSNITAIHEKKENEGIDVPDCRRTVSAPVVRPKDVYLKEENTKFNPCNSVEFLDLAHSSESQETISSVREQADILSEQKTDTESMEDFKNILKPCSLCEKRPRDGNIIHGRTSHLTTCFQCARRLKKTGASCPSSLLGMTLTPLHLQSPHCVAPVALFNHGGSFHNPLLMYPLILHSQITLPSSACLGESGPLPPQSHLQPFCFVVAFLELEKKKLGFFPFTRGMLSWVGFYPEGISPSISDQASP